MKSKAHLFGHSLHQILIAFPVALLSTSVLFDVLWRITGDPKWPPMAFYLIELGVIGGLLAALFGFIDYLGIPPAVRAKRVGALHGFASVVVVTIFAGSWVSRLGHIASPPPAIPSSAARRRSRGARSQWWRSPVRSRSAPRCCGCGCCRS